MKNLLLRVFASAVAVWVYGLINGLLHPIQAVLAGSLAGRQFENSDSAYIQTMFSLNLIQNIGLPAVLLLVVLVWIWWKPISEAFKSSSKNGGDSKLLVFGMVASSLFLSVPENANAYYSKIDETEVYFVLPNETAFWVPSQGDRKENQAALNTVEFLNKAKVSTILFKIEHRKLTGANFGGFDPYIPAGRLIIVDHIPYHREWAAHPARGTSTKDQAIPCQSSEGINITVEISITASIKEENAAAYLYNFGVLVPPGLDRSKPEVMFASVYHARPLDWVMDNIARGQIVNLACAEISSRTFDKANSEAAEIMKKIAAGSTKFLSDRGITTDSIGWAGTFGFDDAVQKAVNDRFIGNAIAVALPVLKTQADIKVKEGLAEGLRKGLPNFLPPFVSEWFSKMFGTEAMQQPAPVKK